MNLILYDMIIEGSVENALYQTCACLLDEEVNVLEETWVRLVSKLGENSKSHYELVLLKVLIDDVYEVIYKRDSVPVREALLLTCKLCLAYKRTHSNAITKPATLQKLRSNIIDVFPVDAKLTIDGRAKFRSLLPALQDEAQFIERIIVGLLRLSESQDNDDFRDALEYISRKRLSITSLRYSDTERGGGPEVDLVPFLWKFLSFTKPCDFQKKCEQLYYWNYKSTIKPHRIGLVVTMAYARAISLHNPSPWSDMERHLLQRVQDSSLDLWKEAKQARIDIDKSSTNSTSKSKAKTKTSTGPQKIVKFPDFYPVRVATPAIIDFNESDIVESRKVNIGKKETGKRGKSETKELKKTLGSPKKPDVNLAFDTLSPFQDAPIDNSARHRRFDFSETWPRAQKHIEQEGYR